MTYKVSCGLVGTNVAMYRRYRWVISAKFYLALFDEMMI